MSPKQFHAPSLTAACYTGPNDASSEGLRSAEGSLPVFFGRAVALTAIGRPS
jgi:hypothetical protein